ncbi:putative integral membrane protein [Acanthocheilonema viteae]
MNLSIGVLIIFVVSTNALSFLTGEWTESMKQFFQQTHQKIGEKSNDLLNELGKNFDSAQNFVEQSKNIFSTVAKNLKNSGEKLKVTVMKTAETTLRGAGDEVEGFFAEVPNRVSDSFDEILAKLGEVCSWIFRNIIAPILFIIILIGLTYIFVVSG